YTGVLSIIELPYVDMPGQTFSDKLDNQLARLRSSSEAKKPCLRSATKTASQVSTKECISMKQTCTAATTPTAINYNRGMTLTQTFLTTFLSTIEENSKRSKHHYMYNDKIVTFSKSLLILADRNAYEFLRLNLQYALPTIQSLNKKLCFVAPMVNGEPVPQAYRCTAFEQLEYLYRTVPQSTLVNIHVVQPITNLTTSSIILSAYGTNNKITSIEILQRWLNIFKQFISRGIRVVGYSTDGDPKYLKAMHIDQIKSEEATNNENRLIFPIHHKVKCLLQQSISILTDDADFKITSLKDLIEKTFRTAQTMAEYVKMKEVLMENSCFNLNKLSESIKQQLSAHTLNETQF
ncbi:unnamed protein product, partial [Didymodactylos carnosus]